MHLEQIVLPWAGIKTDDLGNFQNYGRMSANGLHYLCIKKQLFHLFKTIL